MHKKLFYIKDINDYSKSVLSVLIVSEVQHEIAASSVSLQISVFFDEMLKIY